MLKGRWCILFKKTECQLFNLCYIVMTGIALHNLCIEISDPCQPRWRLVVDDLDLIQKILRRAEDKRESERERDREAERQKERERESKLNRKFPTGYGQTTNSIL